MGFHKVQTYILETENGASLKASGWMCEGNAGDINWQRCNSERQKKARFRNTDRTVSKKETARSHENKMGKILQQRG